MLSVLPYLWGIETIGNDRKLFCPLGYALECATLPMRNWNVRLLLKCLEAVFLLVLPYLWGIETNSEGFWKPENIVLPYLWGIETVYNYRTRAYVYLCYLTYKELKQSRRRRQKIYLVPEDRATLPMRNWNASHSCRKAQSKRLRQSCATLPMRNWNLRRLTFFIPHGMCYLTYEELKRMTTHWATVTFSSGAKVLPYLWGIETRSRNSHWHVTSCATLPMRNWNLERSNGVWLLGMVLPYLWGIETIQAIH